MNQKKFGTDNRQKKTIYLSKRHFEKFVINYQEKPIKSIQKNSGKGQNDATPEAVFVWE